MLRKMGMFGRGFSCPLPDSLRSGWRGTQRILSARENCSVKTSLPALFLRAFLQRPVPGPVGQTRSSHLGRVPLSMEKNVDKEHQDQHTAERTYNRCTSWQIEFDREVHS
jgi:hypothetical protein